MVSNITMETEVCSLQYLNKAQDTVLLNNVRDEGQLVHFSIFCLYFTLIEHRNGVVSSLSSYCRVSCSILGLDAGYLH
jgi:hypothetical protein